MGFYIVADITKIGTSDPITESNSSYTAPDGNVLVGRMHTGDENGKTTYKYAPLMADPNSNEIVSIGLANAKWTDSMRQSDLSYSAPSGWVIIGRKHDGDENGNTSFLIAQVVVDGNVLAFSTDGMTSGNIRESAGIWWVAPNLGDLMQVMTGTTHQGDENGNTTYTGSLLFVSKPI